MNIPQILFKRNWNKAARWNI